MKVLGGVDSTEPHMPQDGRISQMVNGRRVDVRVATFPTTYGEDVAIRTLEKGKLVRGLTELGCSTKNLTLFRDIQSKSRGIVLVTGPTGAGKTTTLYSALAHLGSTEKNILTVEDPVEYQIPRSGRHRSVRRRASRSGPPSGRCCGRTLRADSRLIKQAAVTAGMDTLLGDALAKAFFGQTTIEEVIRVAYQ